MKISDIQLNEAVFSPKNFPYEGNERYYGAGERTNYIAGKINDEIGFPLAKDVKVFMPDAGVIRELPAHTHVFITRPGKIFRGDEVNGPNKVGLYTPIGLRSAHPKDVIGLIPINTIIKPSVQQGRLQKGSDAQDIIAKTLKREYGKNYKFISSAKPGSTLPDLVVEVNGQKVQFEIKGKDTRTAPITFFDKSVRRDQPNDLLDEIAWILSDRLAGSFEELVDIYRKQDPTIGYPGDEGVQKSGKLPTQNLVIREDNKQMLTKLSRYLKQHFKENGDNYFAIHTRADNTVSIYHTEYGPNPLDAPSLPQLREFALKTYGGPSGGAMRVGIKVKLPTDVGLKYELSKENNRNKDER